MVASCTCMRRVKPTVWSVGNHEYAASSSARAASWLINAAVPSDNNAMVASRSSGREGLAASTASDSWSVTAPVPRIAAQ